MKFLKSLFIIICLIGVLFFIGASLFVRFYGKDFVHKALFLTTDQYVEFSTLSYHFPFGVSAKDVKIENIFEAQTVTAQINLASIFQNQLQVTYLEFFEPHINIEKNKPKEVVQIEQPEGLSKENLPEKNKKRAAQNKKSFELKVDRFNIYNGQLNYTNFSSEKPVKFVLQDFRLNAQTIFLPIKSNKTEFEIITQFSKEDSVFDQHEIEGSGWIDFLEKDLDCHLEFKEAPEEVNLTAHAQAENNEMEVQGYLNVERVLDKIKERDKESLGGMLYNFLVSMAVSVDTNYSFKTKVDDFRIDNIAFSGAVETNSVDE